MTGKKLFLHAERYLQCLKELLWLNGRVTACALVRVILTGPGSLLLGGGGLCARMGWSNPSVVLASLVRLHDVANGYAHVRRLLIRRTVITAQSPPLSWHVPTITNGLVVTGSSDATVVNQGYIPVVLSWLEAPAARVRHFGVQILCTLFGSCASSRGVHSLDLIDRWKPQLGEHDIRTKWKTPLT